jgi:hypothetical protein
MTHAATIANLRTQADTAQRMCQTEAHAHGWDLRRIGGITAWVWVDADGHAHGCVTREINHFAASCRIGDAFLFSASPSQDIAMAFVERMIGIEAQ